MLVSSDSHDVVADALVAELTSAHTPMLFDGVETWQYDRGIWLAVEQASIASRITVLLSKCRVVTSNGTKKLRVSKGMVESVGYILKQKIYAPLPMAEPGCLFNGVRINERLEKTIPCEAFHDRVRFGYDLADRPDCPKFEAFCDELFQPNQKLEREATIEFIGACMLGIAYRFQTVFTLFGLGANGKSELINLFVGLFPDAFIGAVSVANWGERFSLIALKGKRLNAVSELPDRNELLTEKFKQVTAGDLVEVEQKNRPTENARIVAGHLFSTNSLAGFINVDAAVMRRLAIIEFRNVFKDSPKRDIAKAILEAERPAIALRCLNAAQALIKRGRYELSKEKYIELIAANDPLYEFAKRHLGKVPKDVHTTYTVYRDYIKARGGCPVNQKNFVTRLVQYKYKVIGEEVSE